VSDETVRVLGAILSTEISPELTPPAAGRWFSRRKRSSALRFAGFQSVLLTRYGFRPSKIAFLAHHAWGDVERGSWPAIFLPLKCAPIPSQKFEPG